MAEWWIVAMCALLGAGLLAWGKVRMRARRSVDEALPQVRIGDLEPGRFRVVGRIVPIATSPSVVDGVRCVYAERADYEMGRAIVPVLRELSHEAVAHPFYLEDETGRLWIDPAEALIECALAIGDAGLVAERRLRAGEEVALSATFRPADRTDLPRFGPYRDGALGWEALADETGPPRLSHRTASEMVRPPPDELTGFVTGAGALMWLVASLLAFVLAFVA
ncbi:MAG: hypothetical protein AB7S26_25005 [Sandaracinaceae bacterium]